MNKLITIIGLSFYFLFSSSLLAQNFNDNPIPFSTNTEEITIWNGNEYLPFFLKGINLGIAIPGTFPGELSATRADYARWLDQIQDAGFNNIRLYTLHYPRFYEVLDSFNIANPHNPIFIFQGVWLNEEIEDYNQDLYMLDDVFKLEMRDNVDCMHGNIIIPHRFGKAYGDFHTDVSKWVMGYVIGREISPQEVMSTNAHHAWTSYSGPHFSISDVTATEVWYTSSMDYIVNYENTNYQTQRPVSFSSWPTLDPLSHPEEIHRDEDTAIVDLSLIEIINAPAGLFVTYHAYPYYPDFISLQSSYQPFNDNYGPNSYMGYLTELKGHYPDLPLIIAEYGVPSSWGVAHYASSGMNHGGFDEFNQGQTNIRMLKTMEAAGCGGGMQFAFLDEWFKRTWVTDAFDYPAERRILWHNITAAEQNFGLISFEKESNLNFIEDYGNDSRIKKLKVGSNYSYLEIELELKEPLDIPDELWIALDTYLGDVGESVLPTGDVLDHRSEFALQIKNYSATLYVTESYDLYGIYHHVSSPNQLYKTTVTDGAPWEIVRWKNNDYYSSVQYIGQLQLNHASVSPNSKDAVTIYDDKITIRLPWSLINFVAPNELKVMNGNKETGVSEDTLTDGIAFSIKYKDQLYSTESRYIWEPWNKLDVVSDSDLQEVYKTSYWVMKDRLHEFNTKAVAVHDSIYLDGPDYPVNVSEEDGVLMNDFDLDGDILLALLTVAPQNGSVSLSTDGSFTYMPTTGFNGYDTFKYCIFDGYSLSEENTVTLDVSGNISAVNDFVGYHKDLLKIYPNPTAGKISVVSEKRISEIILFDLLGNKLDSIEINSLQAQVDLQGYPVGDYILLANVEGNLISRKIVVLR